MTDHRADDADTRLALAAYRGGRRDGLRLAKALLVGNQDLTGTIIDNLLGDSE